MRSGSWSGQIQDFALFQHSPARPKLIGDGRARLDTSAGKCFPPMWVTCAARSFMSPDRQQWLQRRAERSLRPPWMKMTSGRRNLQDIKNHELWMELMIYR